MPRLPTLDDLGQRPSPTPQLGVAPVDLGAPAHALAGVGDAINQIDTHLTEARRASDLTDALGSVTEALGTKEIEMQRDQDFRTAPDRFRSFAQDLGSTTADRIQDPLARQVFQREYQKLAVSKQLGVVQSAAKQEADYNHAQLSANLDTMATAAANASTPLERKVHLDNARMAIGEMRGGEGRPGWITDEQAKALEDKFLVNYYDAKRVRDPAAALQDFVQNREQIRPDLAMRLEQHLFQAAAPVLATQLNAAGGAGVVTAADVPGAKAGESLPRGVRNNNPGNIQRSGVQWQGEVAGNDPRYSAFETPEAGIRALAKNLISYQDDHGLNTVAGIVSRWAPSTENDTAGYAKDVAKALGVDPNAPIDVKDPGTLGKLTRAIITRENGRQPYADTQVDVGVDAALGRGALPAAPTAAAPATAAPAEGGEAGTPAPEAASAAAPAAPAAGTTRMSTIEAALRDPSIPTGNALIDALPADQKLHVLSLARAQGQQDQHAAREQMKGRLQDTEAAYMSTGAAPNPPSDGEVLNAFGQVEGPALIRRMRDVQTLGQNIQAVKTLPDSGIESLVRAAKPLPGEGYAQKLNDWKLFSDAADHVRESRRADPVGYAIASGTYGVKPLQNLADPEAVAAELGQRARAATDMSRDYGTAPTLLTKPEASAMTALLKGAPVETQKTYLATLFNGVGQDTNLFKLAMRQVAADSPVLAWAGIAEGRQLHTPEIPSGFFSQGRPSTDVADLALRGNAILHPIRKEDGANHEGGGSLIKMPDEKLMLSDWTSQTGDAFKGKEQANDIHQQVAKSIYAALSAEDGDYSGNYDSKRWKRSIDFATGGIEKHNGAHIVMPYGWSYDQFRDGLVSRVKPLAGTATPASTTADQLADLPLENVGDGRYVFRRGSGYVVDKQGMPLTVTFSGDGPKAPPPSEAEATTEIPNPGGFSVTKAGAVTGVPRGRRK
jgi:hypothetical protein